MRLLKTTCILVLLVFAVPAWGASSPTSASTQMAADIFVSPLGNDGNPGSEQQPFFTLERARDAVRSLKQREPNHDFNVAIRGGTYHLQQTVVFSTDDSATTGHTITYAAYPGETPVFTSGLPITGWQQVKDDLPGQTAAAKGKLWKASVPAELKDFSVLFDGDQRLPRARGKGFNALAIKTGKNQPTHLDHMHYTPGDVPVWSPGRNWELVVVPFYAWVMNILPIADVNQAQQIVTTSVPATYSMVKSRLRHSPDGTAWIENAIEGLDEPGEWVFDAATRWIYLWPRGDRPSGNIVAPLLSEYIKIEGKTTDARTGDVPVNGLTFRGLTFTQGDRLKWQPDKTGRGLQHDWEMFDRPTAMLRLRGAEGCTVEACRFVNSGGAAIRLDLYAQRNVIRGNLIAHVGGVGVLLAGYGPGLKDVNRNNQVTGNHIHHIGELLWQSAAVFAWQSGENRIAGNLIHHCPYTAIVVSGRIIWDNKGNGECSRTIRWDEIEEPLRNPPSAADPPWSQREKYLHGRRNVVEGNEIYQVMEHLDDGNCIYISGTGGQNVIRDNYLHDVPSPHMNAAIRCDDDQHGTIITGNLIWRTCGEGLINKGNNTFVNNVVADMQVCCEEQRKSGRGFMVMPYGDVKGATIQCNIFYSTDDQIKTLSEDNGIMKGFPLATLRICQADKNVYFCTKNPNWAGDNLRKQCGYDVECNSIEADPRFADVERGNFQLLPNSPALKLGFQQLTVTPISRDAFPFNE